MIGHKDSSHRLGHLFRSFDCFHIELLSHLTMQNSKNSVTFLETRLCLSGGEFPQIHGENSEKKIA